MSWSWSWCFSSTEAMFLFVSWCWRLCFSSIFLLWRLCFSSTEAMFFLYWRPCALVHWCWYYSCVGVGVQKTKCILGLKP
jgi:hypothetical protein